MKLHESLHILGLTEESSLLDLTASFRKLVKKYHPDLNQDKLEWSNRQMVYLNEAYDSAYKKLSEPKQKKNKSDSSQTNQKDMQNATDRQFYSHRKNISFNQEINDALAILKEGLELYYQYGLENIVLRGEGVRKSRYRSSIRRVKKSFSKLKPLSEMHLNKQELSQLEIIVNFIRLVYKSIHIRSIRPALENTYERKAFGHYYYGAKLVDIIIKEIMFKEFVEKFKLGHLTENMKLAEAELNVVLIDYPEAICLREAEIKRDLLFTFLDLIDLDDRGDINFSN